MKDYKENFHNVVNYAVSKTKANVWKLILLGVMGSIYVSIAYVAFIYIIGTFNGVINDVKIPNKEPNNMPIVIGKSINIHGSALAVAAAIFPVGIILIVFLGGSLFTSDNLTSIAVITKKIKIAPVVLKWMYTLIGNLLGALLSSGLMRAGDIFSSENYKLILGYLAGKKIHLQWYYTFFSGILCNIIVAGSVWATLASKHSSAKIFLLYIPIWLFAIAGFQHVVANAILFSMVWFYSINQDEQNIIVAGINFATNDVEKHLGYIPDFFINSNLYADTISKLENQSVLKPEEINNIKESVNNIRNQWVSIGKFSFLAMFANIIPAGIGNWLSGAIILPFTYYWLSSYRKSNLENEKSNDKTNDFNEK